MDQQEKTLSGLIVICGPTAAGKSAIAVELAKRLNTVILSADSRQIYREFDIGTAKPSMQERQQVRHYLLDLCEPTQTFTLAEYQEQARAIIEKCHQQGQVPLLVGGTGLYLQSVTQGLQIPRVAPQPELRQQLSDLGQTQTYQWLQHLDPASAARIHPNDQLRTLRALEVYYVTGKPLSQQQGRQPPAYPILQIGLDCDDLTTRIQHRTRQMLAAGWLQEVADLGARYGWELPLLGTLGYRELQAHLQGTCSLAAATELTVVHTRQFAKRQRTWFRAEPEIEWFDTGLDHTRLDNGSIVLQRVWQRVEEFLGSHAHKPEIYPH